MSSVIKFLLAVLTIGVLTWLTFGCETIRENWPHTKEVMVVEGKEAIEDIVNNPTPGNAVAEGLEWVYLVLAALLGFGARSGLAGSADALKRLTERKQNGDTS